MDVHPGLGDATPDDVAEAHRRDLAIQDQYGVSFLTYWFSDPDGKAFCLAHAPDAETLAAVHKAAHGLMPHEVIEVEAPTLARFMGSIEQDANDRAILGGQPDTGLRAIMFTDVAGSTAIATSRGDEAAMTLIRHHDRIVRAALAECGGQEVKHTGDGILASFVSVLAAVAAANTIQRACHDTAAGAGALGVKIGVSAGEPVQEADDLYGAAVNLAARICAHAAAGQTLVSGSVRDLAIGKQHQFHHCGEVGLKGFPEPVPVFEIDWRHVE